MTRRRWSKSGWLVRVIAAATLAAAPLAWTTSTASAEVPRSQPPVNGPGAAAGAVTSKSGRPGLGWVAGDGVVVTSATTAAEVGDAVTFTRVGSARSFDCWVAKRPAALRFAVLRCDGVTGARLQLSDAFPSPGNAVGMLYITRDGSLVLQPTTISSNDVQFMGETRLRIALPPTMPPAAALDGRSAGDDITAAPLIGEDGRVVGTVLTSPLPGGDPIGTTARDLRGQIKSATQLPPSFAAAAVHTVGKRALIPVIVGLVVGLLWAGLARRGHALAKVLGLAAAGLFGTVGYAALMALAIGPQTLIG